MSIRGTLVKAAVNAKAKVTENTEESIPLDRVNELWHSYSPVEKIVSIGAVDGSLNRKEFLSHILYAVGANSVYFKEEGKEEKLWEDYLVDVGVLKPHEYSDSRLRLYMGILEIKALLKIGNEKKPEILLLDGSLIGNIIRPVTFSFQVDEVIKNSIEQNLFPILKENFSFSKIDSQTLQKTLLENFPREFFPVVAGYLEYLEYLIALETLFKNFLSNIISISKRSSSRVYGFDSVLPDIAIFQKCNLPVGFSKPVEKEITPDIKYNFPRVFSNSFRNKKINIFYVKFKHDIYKVETILSPKTVFDNLSYAIINGYPLPLKLAHDRVKITNRDMETLSLILGENSRTGREGVDI